MSEVVLPRPLHATRALGTSIPKPRKVAATGSSSFIVADIATAAIKSGGAGVMPPPLASLPAITSLPELGREFE